MLLLILSVQLLSSQLGEGAIFDVHTNDNAQDIRPRVWVRFARDGGSAVRHSLIFDTGSDVSHIRDSSAARRPGEDVGVTTGARVVPDAHSSSKDDESPCTIWYGSAGWVRPVVFSHRVPQTAEVIGVRDSIAVDLDILLSPDGDGDDTGLGLLGAALTSPFAESVGIFAFVPPPLRDWPLELHESAGMVLVGETDPRVLSSRCRVGDSIRWTGLQPEAVWQHLWAVEGSVSVIGGGDGDDDQGATETTLTHLCGRWTLAPTF